MNWKNLTSIKHIGTLIILLQVMTLFSYLASYIWTFSYALDVFFQIFQIEWLVEYNFKRCIGTFVA